MSGACGRSFSIKNQSPLKFKPMSNAGPLFRPYDKLVKITLGEKQFEVPDGNMLLRALQFLSPEDVSYGKFCWNEECQYCRVNYDLGPDTPNRTAISCKLMVQDGMRVTEVAQEIKYCLRKLALDLKVKAGTK
jgi:predicted molibdopterin-dependent oxidoreductase YjgC